MLHLISDHFAIVAKAGIVEIPDACVYYSHGEVDQRLIRVDGVEAFLVHVQRHVEDGPVRLRSRQRELKWGPESAVALQPSRPQVRLQRRKPSSAVAGRTHGDVQLAQQTRPAGGTERAAGPARKSFATDRTVWTGNKPVRK